MCKKVWVCREIFVIKLDFAQVKGALASAHNAVVEQKAGDIGKMLEGGGGRVDLCGGGGEVR